MPTLSDLVPRRPMPACVSVIVPAHCEAAVLGETLAEIGSTLDQAGAPFEIVVVDDGSTDDTWSVLVERGRREPRLRALRLSRRFGKEAALAAGLELARGDVAVVMDGDLQHPPALLPAMIDAWRDGADIVEGVKEDRGPERAVDTWRASLFYSLLRRLSGQDLGGASDFKLLDRSVLNAYLDLKERNVFFRGMTAWLGFERRALPFAVAPRRAGRSHFSLLRLVRLAMTAVTSFSSAPLHFVTVLGTGFLAFALVLGAQTLYRKFTGTALDGFTTVILLLLIIGSALMMALGIIGEYIARIYDEVKGRPRYVVRERIGGDERR